MRGLQWGCVAGLVLVFDRHDVPLDGTQALLDNGCYTLPHDDYGSCFARTPLDGHGDQP